MKRPYPPALMFATGAAKCAGWLYPRRHSLDTEDGKGMPSVMCITVRHVMVLLFGSLLTQLPTSRVACLFYSCFRCDPSLKHRQVVSREVVGRLPVTPKALGKVKVKRLAKLSDDISFVRDVTNLARGEKYASLYRPLYPGQPFESVNSSHSYFLLVFGVQGQSGQPDMGKADAGLRTGRRNPTVGQRAAGDGAVRHIRASVYCIRT
jgi:hypothetical protein